MEPMICEITLLACRGQRQIQRGIAEKEGSFRGEGPRELGCMPSVLVMNFAVFIAVQGEW